MVEEKKLFARVFIAATDRMRCSNGKLRLFSELSRTKEHDYQHNNDVVVGVNGDGDGSWYMCDVHIELEQIV